MSSDSGQERTEEATEKRLRESREKGQVARSKEFNTTAVILAGVISIWLFGNHLAANLQDIFAKSFTIKRNEIFDVNFTVKSIYSMASDAGLAVLPFLLLVVVIAILSPILIGGLVFSGKAIMPKLERLDPLKGLKRMFSVKVLIELVKSILKFTLLIITFLFIMNIKLEQIFMLDTSAIESSVSQALEFILFTSLALVLSLSTISLIDIPFQIWDHARQLKMTKQEVRDEYKDTEGKPEVKSRQRAIQREMRRKRMMSEVPKADVVITNPTHYAVAVKYDDLEMNAPRIVAKGADVIASMIKKVAEANDVPIVSAPSLARAIYFNVEIEEEIPSALYMAVAKILAYVYELRLYNQNQIQKPSFPYDLQIPDGLDPKENE